MGQGSRPQVSARVYRRRRAVVLFALALLILVPIALFVWPGFATSDDADSQVAQPRESPVTQEPVPTTPSIDPMERADDLTELQKAIPTEVLRFALVDERNETDFDATGPQEMWSATFADGTGADAVTIDVVIGQWDEASKALEGFDALDATAGESKPETGAVLVDDEPVGTWTLRTDGVDRGTVVWRNDTVAVKATGPRDDIEGFYAAFPF